MRRWVAQERCEEGLWVGVGGVCGGDKVERAKRRQQWSGWKGAGRVLCRQRGGHGAKAAGW